MTNAPAIRRLTCGVRVTAAAAMALLAAGRTEAQSFAGCDSRGNCYQVAFSTAPAGFTTPAGDPLDVLTATSVFDVVADAVYFGQFHVAVAPGHVYYPDPDLALIGLRPLIAGAFWPGTFSDVTTVLVTSGAAVLGASLDVSDDPALAMFLVPTPGTPVESVRLSPPVAVAAPEPGMLPLTVTGLLVLGGVARRRRTRNGRTQPESAD
jgi:hypothetical protein